MVSLLKTVTRAENVLNL